MQAKSSLKSDIWALGCLLYEMACLEPPFVAQNHLSLAMKIKNAKIPKITGRYSSELTRVVNYTL
jgi:NIMA (never in mitosis gene a)-related kinase